jgi:hypothetical protein
MGFFDEIVMVLVVTLVLSTIGMVNLQFWSFLFALFFSTAISTFIASRFARNQKTLGSQGRFSSYSTVYLFFMIGIVVSSVIGSWLASFLLERLDTSNFMTIPILSFVVSLFGYALVKSGLY